MSSCHSSSTIPTLIPMDRNEPQPRCEPDLGKHLQRLPLVIQQRLRDTEQNADHAVLAPRATHGAVVAIDHHGAGVQPFAGLMPGACSSFIVRPLVLGIPRTVTTGTDTPG